MPQDVTALLLQWNDGHKAALDKLLPLVSEGLHKLASIYLSGERSNDILQPTALVNELYLRLVDRRRVQWQNRAHFFGFAATTLRRILVDHARNRQSLKRGSGQAAITLNEADILPVAGGVDILDLNRALEKLAALEGRLGRVVELRYFAGLTIEETAEVLSVGRATVVRDWNTARAFLLHQLKYSEVPAAT